MSRRETSIFTHSGIPLVSKRDSSSRNKFWLTGISARPSSHSFSPAAQRNLQKNDYKHGLDSFTWENVMDSLEESDYNDMTASPFANPPTGAINHDLHTADRNDHASGLDVDMHEFDNASGMRLHQEADENGHLHFTDITQQKTGAVTGNKSENRLIDDKSQNVVVHRQHLNSLNPSQPDYTGAGPLPYPGQRENYEGDSVPTATKHDAETTFLTSNSTKKPRSFSAGTYDLEQQYSANGNNKQQGATSISNKFTPDATKVMGVAKSFVSNESPIKQKTMSLSSNPPMVGNQNNTLAGTANTENVFDKTFTNQVTRAMGNVQDKHTAKQNDSDNIGLQSPMLKSPPQSQLVKRISIEQLQVTVNAPPTKPTPVISEVPKEKPKIVESKSASAINPWDNYYSLYD